MIATFDQIKAQVDANIARGKPAKAAPVKDMQSDRGINYNIDGLLGDTRLRGFVKPVSHYLRDWQHTLAASGVAGSLLAGVCDVLKKTLF